MVDCDTTAQVWQTLDIYFASQIHAKVSQFKTLLKNTKKESWSMDEYLLKIRNCVSLLGLVGQRFGTKEHVEAIFEGLSSEYETFVLTTEARTDSYSVEEVESLLLAQEARIEKNHKNLDSVQANLASTSQHYAKKKFSLNFGQKSNFAQNFSNSFGRGFARHQKYGWVLVMVEAIVAITIEELVLTGIRID